MVRDASLIEEHDSGTIQVLTPKMHKLKFSSKMHTKSVRNPFVNSIYFLIFFSIVLLYVVLMVISSLYMTVIRLFTLYIYIYIYIYMTLEPGHIVTFQNSDLCLTERSYT